MAGVFSKLAAWFLSMLPLSAIHFDHIWRGEAKPDKDAASVQPRLAPQAAAAAMVANGGTALPRGILPIIIIIIIIMVDIRPCLVILHHNRVTVGEGREYWRPSVCSLSLVVVGGIVELDAQPEALVRKPFQM